MIDGGAGFPLDFSGLGFEGFGVLLRLGEIRRESVSQNLLDFSWIQKKLNRSGVTCTRSSLALAGMRSAL